MLAQAKIFREYDIRGTVGVDFDAELARQLGAAYARIVKRERSAKDEWRVAVGRDCRLSGPELSDSLIQGILAEGVHVVDTGMGPTPQLYYMVCEQELDGGIQVTGSHNPSDQNGFKMMIGTRTLSGAAIQELRREIEQGRNGSVKPAAQADVEQVDARSAYINELIKRSLPNMGSRKKLKVVVDGGNGVGGLVGPAVLRGIGCEVIEIFTEPDGRFPNHHPDPTVLENIRDLRKRVVEEKADAGIAWDGDADRIGVVDERGEPIFGDMLLVIFGRALIEEVGNPTIIGDVKCSELMFRDLEQRGAKTVMAKTGHSLIKAKLKELKAELAGEMSGHIFFSHRYYGFDDALYAAARLVEILSASDKSLSQLLADIPQTVSTPEIRVDCPEEVKFQLAERAQTAFPEYQTNTLDGVRVTFEHGWGLVRASNTQPVLVMRFEADTPQHLEQYQTLVEQRLDALRKELS